MTGVRDILEELNLTMIPEKQAVRAAVPANETEAVLLNTSLPIRYTWTTFDSKAGCPSRQVTSSLALMELKGMVLQSGE